MTTNAGADECGWEPFPPLPIIIYEANAGLREWTQQMQQKLRGWGPCGDKQTEQ